MLVQAGAPDAFAPGLHDSPAGLAAWLVDKYRRWSDCDGDVERRFSKDDLCDFLTLYWSTGTIASSMRLYAAEARDLWRLEPGERIMVPTAVADFPAEMLHPPRAWTERQLADIRRWTEFDRGGHFAAFEEPDLLADDVIAFLAESDDAAALGHHRTGRIRSHPSRPIPGSSPRVLGPRRTGRGYRNIC